MTEKEKNMEKSSKKYSVVLFDLDGTVVDSGEGVTNSVAYALDKFGISVDDKKQLTKFIGPPLVYSFKAFYNFDENQALEAINYYREYYTSKGIFEGYVYDGVEKLLSDLKQAGMRLILATSKPEEFARQIMERAGLDKYFEYMAGASMDERTRNTKIEVIDYALKTANIDTPSDVVMVGDRFYDIEGAHHFGIDCIAVEYGYGNREEFERYNADYIAKTPLDVSEILIK